MNMNKEKVLLFWSGGKDSALAHHLLTLSGQYEIAALVCVLDRETNRVRFHGIPDSLIIEQSKMLKLPLQRVFIPQDSSNAEYIKQLSSLLTMYKKRGITKVAFGDVNLEDVRGFREKMLQDIGMEGLFPLWQKKTDELVKLLFETNHKALITSVMKEKLGPEFLACEFNQEYVNRLPAGVDPAGENGEFHTFITFGPQFKMRVAFSKSIAVDEGPYLVSLLKEP